MAMIHRRQAKRFTPPSICIPRTARGWDALLIAGLLLLGVAIPYVTGVIAGSLEIPRNDDWAYRRIALELAGTGVISLHGVTTMIIGQILIAQPLLWLSGLHPWAFTAAGVLFATGGVIGAYVLARQFLAPLRAVLPALLLLLFPGYLAYATSFMSDVPALAAQLFCLAMGAIAFRRRPVREPWLLASVAVGCGAFSVREFAIAAPASVLVGAICAEPRRLRHWGLAIAVATGVGLLSLFRLDLPGQDLGGGILVVSISQTTQALAIVALVLSPAALAGALRWRSRWQRLDVVIGAEIGLVLAGARLFQWYQNGTMPLVILNKIASQYGAPQREMFLGDRPLLFGDASWAIVNGLALGTTVAVLAVGAGIAGAYLRRCDRSLGMLIKGLGSPVGLLVLFSLGLAIGLTVYGSTRAVFDRYYWALVPPIATLYLYVPRSIASPRETSASRVSLVFVALAMTILAVLTSVSVIFMLNSNAFDAARWRAGERLVHLGLRPEEIDAGSEWVSYYRTSASSALRECGFVTSKNVKPSGVELVGTMGYSLYLVGGQTEPLYVYRRTGPECMPD